MKKLILLASVFAPALAFAQCPATSLNISRTISGVNYQTGTSYTIAATDANKFVSVSNASGVALTLPNGWQANFACQVFEIQNNGIGAATVTCTSCTINGSATLTLAANQGVTLWNDGLNYTAHLYGLASSFYYPNSANGTTCNELAKVDQAAGSTTLGRATTTAGSEVPPNLLGIVSSGCGTSGNATIVASGYTTAVFDSATVTVGDAIGVSSTAGPVTDLGSPNPSSGSPIGQVVASPAGAVPSGCTAQPGCWINLQMGASGGSGGSTHNVVNNPSSTQTITPTATGVVPLVTSCPSGAAATDLCFKVVDGAGNTILSVQKNGQVTLGNSINGTPTINLAPHAFSTLAACASGTEGTMAAVTDSSSATWGATISGSGSNHVLAYCDGTNWTVAAK